MADRISEARKELARRELAKRQGGQSAAPRAAPQSPDQPNMERQNILGAIFNVPGATSRAAIQSNPRLAAAGPLAGLVGLSGGGGKEAQIATARGALNPSSVPTFQDQAIEAGQNSFGGPSTSVLANAAKGFVPSAAGLAADMWTDPTTVLTNLLFGIKVPKIKTVADVVDKPFLKAIRPTGTGVKTRKGMENIVTKARSAVESVVDNKDSLKIIDSTGEIVPDNLPNNLDEATQAIGQTVKTVFKRYDAMNKQAGEAGVKIATDDIVREITQAVESPVIKDLSPSVAKYGLELAERLKARGAYTLEETQDMVSYLNSKLKSSFKNPTPESLHQTVIDRAVVNQLRKAMIEGVERHSGPGYAALRKEYGALAEMEGHFVKAALRDAGKNSKLGGLVDVYNAAEIVSGIATLNPTAVVKGGIRAAAKAALGKLTDPNRAVKTMFREVDQIKNVGPKSRALQFMVRDQIKKEKLKSTEEAIRYGDSIRGDKSKIDALQSLHTQTDVTLKDLFKLKNPTPEQEQMMMNLATKKQLLRESMQVAKGTETAAERGVSERILGPARREKVQRMRMLRELVKKGTKAAVFNSTQNLRSN